MARGDSLYARLDVNEIRSLRFNALPEGARCLWVFLWCYALENRTHIIDRPSDNQLRNFAGLSHKPVSKYLQTLNEQKYIVLKVDTIEILNIREKHQQFQWSSSPNGDQSPPKRSPKRPLLTERNGTERNKEKYTQAFESFWESFPFTSYIKGSKPKGFNLFRFHDKQGNMGGIIKATANLKEAVDSGSLEAEFMVQSFLAKKPGIQNHWTAWVEKPDTKQSKQASVYENWKPKEESDEST